MCSVLKYLYSGEFRTLSINNYDFLYKVKGIVVVVLFKGNVNA